MFKRGSRSMGCLLVTVADTYGYTFRLSLVTENVMKFQSSRC
jgi:hypothetical protein